VAYNRVALAEHAVATKDAAQMRAVIGMVECLAAARK
jgi:hypothetical protein